MKKEVIKEIIIYGLIILAIILLRTYVVTLVRVNGTSMYPTLRDNEIMILNKINYVFNDIERFDIVVVETEDTKLIKRVVGLPGESLKYENDTLYINGNVIEEDYLAESTDDFELGTLGYEVLPENCYFVIGDNRDNSSDSRHIGCVKKEQIEGSASTVIFPFDRMGKME